MRKMILIFGTERHGEVEVKVAAPEVEITADYAKEIAARLLPTYRTPRHHIPLKEFRRARLVTKQYKVINK